MCMLQATVRPNPFIRSRPDFAARYVALKFELAQRHSTDREAYTNAKTEFVRCVLESA